MTIDPRIPTMSGRSTLGFHQPGRHLLAPSAERRGVFGEAPVKREGGSSCQTCGIAATNVIDEGGVVVVCHRCLGSGDSAYFFGTDSSLFSSIGRSLSV